jgi:LacI family transcriptional regulator
MATRREVAELAGTSAAVVSYVLNGGPRPVAPATRQRVLAAVEELGYRPNALARSLRTRRTMTFGLVVPDNSNPFFAELARWVEEVGFEYGYTMLLGNATDDDDREAAYVRALLDHRVDGLMVVPAHGSRTWTAELAASALPRVVLDREIEIPNAAHVLADHAGGAYAATTHLIEHGHRRIGCLAGVAGQHPTVERVSGWQRAIQAAGLDPAAMPLVYTPFGRAYGYQVGRAMLAADDRPDALFVTSDEQAIGVLRAAADLGVRVPQDLALCSFDGIEGGAYTVPALTTMRQPIEQLGRAAMEWMVARIADPDLPASRVVLETTLVARGSCGCTDPTYGGPGSVAPPSGKTSDQR